MHLRSIQFDSANDVAGDVEADEMTVSELGRLSRTKRMKAVTDSEHTSSRFFKQGERTIEKVYLTDTVQTLLL